MWSRGRCYLYCKSLLLSYLLAYKSLLGLWRPKSYCMCNWTWSLFCDWDVLTRGEHGVHALEELVSALPFWSLFPFLYLCLILNTNRVRTEDRAENRQKECYANHFFYGIIILSLTSSSCSLFLTMSEIGQKTTTYNWLNYIILLHLMFILTDRLMGIFLLSKLDS